jgi:hypothetical protein
MVEKILNIVQCTDREKVLHASRKLEGTVVDWWDAYTAAHVTPNTITWQEFKNKFREQHIPKGLMKLKKQEFLALKQGAMSVSEYQDKFIQLSCYAPTDVADEQEKQDHFRDGLIGPIRYQLMVHTFKNFQKMVDNAIMVEHARKEMGEKKRKFESSGQFSKSHALVSRPRKEHLFALEDRVSTTGIINTSTPINRTSSKLSVLVSQCSIPAFRKIARTPLLEDLGGTTPLLPPVVIHASDVVRWDTMPMVVPRGMPRILYASSTKVDRGRLHSSNSPETTTRCRITTRVSRTTSAGM